MKHTQNYNLNQWEASDKVQRTDFNADNAKIDGALAALAAGKGNGRIETGSYVGSGEKYGEVSIKTSFPPKAIFVMSGIFGVAVRPCEAIRFVSSIARTAGVTWRDDGLSWRNSNSSMDESDFMNAANTTYYYVVIG